MKLKGQIVDIPNKRIFKGELVVSDGKIEAINECQHDVENFILPGFVDAHIHIESSMLVPSEFARLAVNHGTVSSVSDPHEIANVLGVQGVEFMIANGNQSPFKFNFGAPSCVPATSFESSGATIDSNAIKSLLAKPEIKYLAEMMNYPGVLMNDAEVQKKIAWAKYFDKPVDGHAPGLRGHDISNYINAGISTDHECYSYDEALEKLQKGMKILIREGSAAKNFEALIDLLPEHFQKMMFCSDDKHPDDLILGHINQLCQRAVAKGIDVFKVLQVACVNPVKHYNLEVGLLNIDDPADFIVVDTLSEFNVLQTYIDGQLVSENGKSLLKSIPFEVLNNFDITHKSLEDFKISSSNSQIRVIEALDGQLVTNHIQHDAIKKNGELIANKENDILKITVVNRYQNQKPALGFIRGFGLKSGAIASSVAHDSHNIIAVGEDDESLCAAVNAIIEHKGGICAVSQGTTKVLSLPVAGIMSDKDGDVVGASYAELDDMAKSMGSALKAPFMTLSFMALLVIPSLKLSDKGLFDGQKFKFCDVCFD